MASRLLFLLPASTPLPHHRPAKLSLAFVPAFQSGASGKPLRLLSRRLALRTRPLRRPAATCAASASILPTSKRGGDESGIIPEWSERAVKSFGMAELEARKLKYPTTGTEALLMGILIEGTNFASKFLRSNGITLFKVREEAVKLLGKSDLYFFSPEHPPLTESAQRALDRAIDEKLKSGDIGEVTTCHLLVGIWSEEDSPGHKILASLGFDNEKASELAKNAGKDH